MENPETNIPQTEMAEQPLIERTPWSPVSADKIGGAVIHASITQESTPGGTGEVLVKRVPLENGRYNNGVVPLENGRYNNGVEPVERADQ